MLNTYTESSGQRRTFDSLGAFAAHLARRAAVNRGPVLIETTGQGLDVTELVPVMQPAAPLGAAGAVRGWADVAVMLALMAVAWGGCLFFAARG